MDNSIFKQRWFFFFERFLSTCLNFIVFRYEATRPSGSIALICYQDATRKAKLFPSNWLKRNGLGNEATHQGYEGPVCYCKWKCYKIQSDVYDSIIQETLIISALYIQKIGKKVLCHI